MKYETFEEVMNERSITAKVLAWQPKRDSAGRPIYVRLDPEMKRRIVQRVEQKLAMYIIQGERQ